jgi:DNA invertase Pin-like site-specific DNA recombinase
LSFKKFPVQKHSERTAQFNIIGSMAEFERELIRERVRAGMKNAKAKGARIGRPRANVDASQITRLRDSGASLREIASRLGVKRRHRRRVFKKRSLPARP